MNISTCARKLVMSLNCATKKPSIPIKTAGNSVHASSRDAMWNTALEGWRHFPVFGVGMDNYSGITPARLEAWRREAGKPYVAADYARFPHGHSLFFNTLAERGAFGAGVLAVVMLAWGAALVRRRPAEHRPQLPGQVAGHPHRRPCRHPGGTRRPRWPGWTWPPRSPQ